MQARGSLHILQRSACRTTPIQHHAFSCARFTRANHGPKEDLSAVIADGTRYQGGGRRTGRAHTSRTLFLVLNASGRRRALTTRATAMVRR